MAINIGPFRPGLSKASARLVPALLCAVGSSVSLPAGAIEFQLGDIEGRFDSHLSVGASWRLEDADPDLISTANGGRASRNSGSFDDGNQNFEQGETFSQIFKGIHDLELRHDNQGVFLRGKYWYDNELENGGRPHGHAPNGYDPGAELDDSGFDDFARFSGIELLDAYWYGEFDLAGRPLDLRLGRQVVNWGESTFIQGGINVINPFDVNAFRRAGAEVKEGLLPVNMAFASFGLTDNLSVEGFYQFDWEATSPDGCGTYFSTDDFSAEGCDGIRINAGALDTFDDQAYFGFPFADLVVHRHANGQRDADDDGQFGLAMRYFAEEFNSTEFGLYLARYHSRLPIISGVKNIDPALIGSPFPATLGSEYYVEYPEDIKMLGLSFNTSLGDVAWSGEISHKQDVPLQINGPQLVAGLLTNGATGSAGIDGYVAGPFGLTVQGYQPFDVTQLQTTFVKFFDRVLGASRLTLVGELGWTHVHDLDESADALKFGRSGAFGWRPGDNSGFVTADSYGYVVRGSLEYPDAFAGVNLKPEISFKHGIEGYGPQPGGAFNEGQKTLSLSLTGDYLNRYAVQLAYTGFFGGDYNELEDRDFVSLSASVAF